MSWLDTGHLSAALSCLVIGLLAGWWCPLVIGRLPEPAEPDADEPDPLEEAASRKALPPAPPKELYADIAALPGLAWKTAVASGLTAAVFGASVGWSWSLMFLLPLAPVGVALALVDWRTTLLPTRIVAPAYAVTIAAVLAAALAEHSRDRLLHAVIGWAVMGGIFFVLWFIYPRGLGYGDVRLSGVLGLALGYRGWAELATGVYGAFLIGGLGGALLSLLRMVNRKRFPFGPFMLVAAVVAVAFGPSIVGVLGY